MSLTGQYNRFDPSKGYEEHIFRSGYVLQSAELNEIQSAHNYRIKGIGDALFKDGDVVRDARIIVNESTGVVRCEAGAVYLRGAVRGIPPATLTIATTGVVAVGIYIQTSDVTELDDSGLRDPAALTRNYQEPGAGRLKVVALWGFAGDSQSGDFFPVYSVENGVLRAKEPPPSLDSFNQVLARYDRDSSGGSYVVSGLKVARQADLNTGEQVYTVSEGRARVNGYGIEQSTSRRLIYAAAPDLRLINSEPHLSTTTGAQRVNTDRFPINDISEVNITAQKTVTVVHGGFVGAQDPLPDTSVLQILSVVQGGTTYTPTADYLLTAGKVNWSPAGAEPATGSTYTVTYQYINAVTPTDVDDTGFTVTGAVSGSLIMVDYNQKLPRIDRLAITPAGQFVWVQGVSADYNQQPPILPSDVLALATVTQFWSADTTVSNDGVRVVPMSELGAINGRIDYVLGIVAQQRLEGSANLREAIQKKGLAVDPFLDDSLRDAGVSQTAAVVGGELTLAVGVDAVSLMPSDITEPSFLAYSLSVVLEQMARTGVTKINPYMAFDPIPALVTLTPSVDRWTVVNTTWASAITERFTRFAPGWHGVNLSFNSSNESVQLLSSVSRPDETLRTIVVNFRIAGLGPGEVVTGATFDGITVVTSVP